MIPRQTPQCRRDKKKIILIYKREHPVEDREKRTEKNKNPARVARLCAVLGSDPLGTAGFAVIFFLPQTLIL